MVLHQLHFLHTSMYKQNYVTKFWKFLVKSLNLSLYWSLASIQILSSLSSTLYGCHHKHEITLNIILQSIEHVCPSTSYSTGCSVVAVNPQEQRYSFSSSVILSFLLTISFNHYSSFFSMNDCLVDYLDYKCSIFVISSFRLKYIMGFNSSESKSLASPTFTMESDFLSSENIKFFIMILDQLSTSMAKLLFTTI